MASGMTMLRIKEILDADIARRYVVVSAPGKRFSTDAKVTDLLLESYRSLVETGLCGAAFGKVRERFLGIVCELGIDFDMTALLDETQREIEREHSEEFTASRGEYLAARLTAAYLKAPFVDARDVIRFDAEGKLQAAKSYLLLADVLRGNKRAVIAGFYGADEAGRVHTFSRGGSDITGAIVARAVGADLYENWTDVSGFMVCDPRIVENPARIRTLSYKELRELSYMGAGVLHSESIFPVREADIPIRIKNTFRPDDPGTDILPTSKCRFGDQVITGIAGKKNFTVIFVEKSLMNLEIGFVRKILSVFERHHISIEHIPTGIDTVSFVIDSTQLHRGEMNEMLREIGEAVRPDHMHTFSDVAVIAIVGHGMSRNIGTSARLFGAIARAGVNVRMIDQGSSELNIIVGVDNENYERTLRAVYDEFFRY